MSKRAGTQVSRILPKGTVAIDAFEQSTHPIAQRKSIKVKQILDLTMRRHIKDCLFTWVKTLSRNVIQETLSILNLMFYGAEARERRRVNKRGLWPGLSLPRSSNHVMGDCKDYQNGNRTNNRVRLDLE